MDETEEDLDKAYERLPRYEDPPPDQRPSALAICAKCQCPIYTADALVGELCLRCACPAGYVYIEMHPHSASQQRQCQYTYKPRKHKRDD